LLKEKTKLCNYIKRLLLQLANLSCSTQSV